MLFRSAALHWDEWLGPAASRPYDPAYVPFRWRGWWDFGCGAVGDMAIHLADPAYAPLNASIQGGRGKHPEDPCRFGDFLVFLDAHWDQLSSDGHLCPQSVWLADGTLFNRRIDRDQLVKELPVLLQPFLDPVRLGRVRQELNRYDEVYRQRLGKRWEQEIGRAHV